MARRVRAQGGSSLPAPTRIATPTGGNGTDARGVVAPAGGERPDAGGDDPCRWLRRIGGASRDWSRKERPAGRAPRAAASPRSRRDLASLLPRGAAFPGLYSIACCMSRRLASAAVDTPVDTPFETQEDRRSVGIPICGVGLPSFPVGVAPLDGKEGDAGLPARVRATEATQPIRSPGDGLPALVTDPDGRTIRSITRPPCCSPRCASPPE